MYRIDRKDRVAPIDGVPRPDVGAPLPAIVADEHCLLLSYIVSEPDPNWDGTYVNVISPDSSDVLIATVQFEAVHSHMFGAPNDEAFNGHPLYSRGLKPYSVSEVERSSWIRSLEKMNAVHPSHRREHFDSYHHYIFAFHDSTFECVAQSFTVEQFRGSMREAVGRMVTTLEQRAA